MEFEFNQGQLELAGELVNWYSKDEKQIYTYSGPAGSGKTTVIFHVLELLHIPLTNVIAVALSGKAVNVLGQHNLPAQTIHSLIYVPTLVICKDEEGMPIKLPDGSYKKRLAFCLRDKLPDNIKLIIVDELSMVSDEIMKDILSFGIPVIGMGDINQLPPIFRTSSYMLQPDFYLTEIMRQAKDDPIIMLSQRILHYEPLIIGEYGLSRVLRSIRQEENLLTDYDIILCARNITRDFINDRIRLDIQNKTRLPQIGDKVICRQNNRDRVVSGKFLSNGTVGFISYIDPATVTSKKCTIDFSPEYNRKDMFYDLRIDRKYIAADYLERKEWGLTSDEKFEYGYCITTHLSQGSQYHRVLYLDEPFGGGKEMIKKLRYTAITRAITNIDIVLGYY